MNRIVTTTYRYKRPPRKRKAVELELPAVIRAGKRTEVPAKSRKHPAMGKPANDDRKPTAVAGAGSSRGPGPSARRGGTEEDALLGDLERLLQA